MILSEHFTLLFLLILIQSGVEGSVIVKRDNNGSETTGNHNNGSALEKTLFGGPEEINLEQEIIQEVNRLNSRKQREIFDDLEKQQERFNVSQKSLILSETENLSPLNVEELKSIRKTIKTSNSSLPAIRNKRTLNFLLQVVARAMGYTLTPSNPDAEWIPRQQPPPAQPCSTPAPPCRPNPPSTPPPCAMPPTTPPCPGSNAMMQPATIPPNQINANTISYPYRPARTIPLLNFAPLPAGIRVPYPPLFQPPAQQNSPCNPPQPPPPPCGAPPASPPPPCATPAPSTPPPCKPMSAPSPPPCGSTPAPSPSPCGAAPPPPCNPKPAPPCATTPPPPPPCNTTPAPPPPCMTTPAPPPPCMTTPAPPPPCGTPAPRQPPPCGPPQAPKPPPCSTPAPPPCGNPPSPPCGTPAPAPCGNPPPPPPPPPETPKKGSILLEYDDPVRIQIFSNDKKYLPASGNIFSGHDDDKKEDWHSHFFPSHEKTRKNDEYDEKEEMEEEHIEEEEDEVAPGQLKHYEEEDERVLSNNEEEEDESETNLSIVKKPVDQDMKKTHTRRVISSKTKQSTTNDKDVNTEEEEEDKKFEKTEKSQKMKKPKRKKWIRIVKKQRRKTKTDSNPNNFEIYSSDAFPEGSQLSPKYFGKRESQSTLHSFEKNFSDYSDSSSSSDSTEDMTNLDLKKVTLHPKDLTSPALKQEARRYEYNFNPFAPEPEDQRRKKLEKAVERYVEDYVEKQLGDELIKNTGVPKTTVFEFSPRNGPKIQTITTTVAKTTGNPKNFKPETRSLYKSPTGNSHIIRKNIYEENLRNPGDYSYEAFRTHK